MQKPTIVACSKQGRGLRASTTAMGIQVGLHTWVLIGVDNLLQTTKNKKGITMTSKKLSDVMKAVLDVTDGVLGRPASRSQVIQVLELIESFEAPVKTQTKVATQTKPVKAKRKIVNNYISWRGKKGFFDSMLDGNKNVITFIELSNKVPEWRGIRRSSLRNRFRQEAMSRGYQSASVSFDNRLRTLTVQALPLV